MQDLAFERFSVYYQLYNGPSYIITFVKKQFQNGFKIIVVDLLDKSVCTV